MKAREEFFGQRRGLFGRRGVARRSVFHQDEDGRVWRENLQRVPDEVFGVVILATAEVQLWLIQGKTCLSISIVWHISGGPAWATSLNTAGLQSTRGKPAGMNTLECHGFQVSFQII